MTSNPITTTLYAHKLNHNGQLIWDREVTFFPYQGPYRGDSIYFRNLIETADGGYLMILEIEKARPC